MGSHVNENKKIFIQNPPKNSKNSKKKMSEHMAQGKELKFERNLCIRFRDNCNTDYGRMTDR